MEDRRCILAGDFNSHGTEFFPPSLSYIEDRDFFAPDHVVSRGGHVESRSIDDKINDGYYLSDHKLLLSTVSI
jgi:hypothetical protein